MATPTGTQAVDRASTLLVTVLQADRPVPFAELAASAELDIDLEPVTADHSTRWVQHDYVAGAGAFRIERPLHRQRHARVRAHQPRASAAALESELEPAVPRTGRGVRWHMKIG